MGRYSANLEKLLTSVARKIITRRAVETGSAAKGGAPDALKGDVRYAVKGASYKDLKATVYVDDKHGLEAEEGIRPYIIRPRNGKFLVFPGTNNFKGKIIFTKIVHHPGHEGRHFLRNALNRTIK